MSGEPSPSRLQRRLIQKSRLWNDRLVPPLSAYETAVTESAPVAEEQPSPQPSVRDRTYDDSRRRSLFFDLLWQEKKLKTELDKTWLFGKADLHHKIALVQRDISRQRTAFSDLASLTLKDAVSNPVMQASEKAYKTDQLRRIDPSDQAKRQQLLNEIMAGERTIAAEEIRKTDQIRRETGVDVSSNRAQLTNEKFSSVYTALNQLLANPPKWYQSQDSWFLHCLEKERDLDIFAQRDNRDQQVQIFRYWNKKLQVIDSVQPSFFGRDRWQKEQQRTRQKIEVLRPLLKAKPSE